jgi:hypothetical protein
MVMVEESQKRDIEKSPIFKGMKTLWEAKMAEQEIRLQQAYLTNTYLMNMLEQRADEEDEAAGFFSHFN